MPEVYKNLVILFIGGGTGLDMKALLKNVLALNLYKGTPLKYREAAYTIAELKKRLIAETTRQRQK